ncbi:hypothetical protein [Streptomyces sp. NPDC094149]|uniref:hypothetical protein n=1 Tax=Streptomyces sp. NPDC094149 TaxID=3155079 RepID=UPI00331CE37F
MTFKAEADGAVADWEEWPYVPAVGVGPLRFGMTVDEVVEAAEVLGRTQVMDCRRDHAVFSPTWRIEVRRGVASTGPVVTADVSHDAGLFWVAANAVHGPQVKLEGICLVGRDLSELESEEVARDEAGDGCFRHMPEGYAGPDDSGVVMRGQLVGPVLRSRPLFVVSRDGAYTKWDSMPDEEYRHGQSPDS